MQRVGSATCPRDSKGQCLGVRTRADALFVFGFPPNARPDQKAIHAQFRMLATVHHPDSGYGQHDRMTQLNDALSTRKDGR